MAGARKHYDKGLTFVEVMITLLVVLIIAIGVMSYMYATAAHAHLADVRATASRLGLLLLEGWKTQAGDILLYDPQIDFDINTLIPFNEFASIPNPSDDMPELENVFKYYRIRIDYMQYFVKVSYQYSANGQQELNVAIAWDRNSGDNTLDYSHSRLISQTKFATYVVE